MDYNGITKAALDYADKNDPDLDKMMGTFLRVVEARINRELKVARMSKRATISAAEGQRYFSLPFDFIGLRDIEVRSSEAGETDGGITLHYLAPELMNSQIRDGGSMPSYTIIAEQLHIHPYLGDTLEIVYQQALSPLTPTNLTNWVSDHSPDVYIFGLLVEINAYVRASDAAQIWESRFGEQIGKIRLEDASARWSGPALQIRLG